MHGSWLASWSVDWDPSVVVRLTGLLSGYLTPRAVQVAAEFGIGELLRAGPRSAAELAASSQTDAAMLEQVLQVLVSAEVVTYDNGAYGPTALSDHLVLFDQPFTGEESWRCWTELATAVRTGESPFQRLFGKTMFEYLDDHPDKRERWNLWNTTTVSSWLQPLIAALRVEPGETVIDVGGGEGALLASVLTANPETSGVLVDLPEVVKGAPPLLAAAGVADRCRIQGGDAFTSVPGDGDVYIVSRVLFNWSDLDAVRLLRSVRLAMPPGARLYIIENLAPDDRLGVFAANSLRLSLLLDSRHHNERDMRAICEAAGLSVTAVTAPPAGSMFALVEATRGL
jgi:SAM-dependent methyltransferase